MTDYEKLVPLLNGVFKEIKFTEIKRLDNGTFHLVDKTSEMWIRIVEDKAQVSFVEDFSTVFQEFDLASVE